MRWLIFAIFILSSFTDAMLTSYLISFDHLQEGNPIMSFAIKNLPGGMLSVKTGVILGIAVFWKKSSDEFLVGIALGMTLITFWNSILLSFCL